MIEDVYYLNNSYPMPKVGLGVYKITEEEMETSIEAALALVIEHLILHIFIKMKLHLVMHSNIQIYLAKIYLLLQNYGMIIKVMIKQSNILPSLLKTLAQIT